jgi:hypothetical protein
MSSPTEPQPTTQDNGTVHLVPYEVPWEVGNQWLEQGEGPLEQFDVGWDDGLGDPTLSQNSQSVNEPRDDLSEPFPQYPPDDGQPFNDLLLSGPSDGLAEGFSQHPPNGAGPLEHLLQSGPSDDLQHQDSSQHFPEDGVPFDDLLYGGSFDVDVHQNLSHSSQINEDLNEVLRHSSLFLDPGKD